MTRERNGRSWLAVGQATGRRNILARAASGLLLPPLAACADHDVVGSAAAGGAVDRAGTMTVVVDQSIGGPPVGAGYAGFSYEKSSLSTGLFAASNQPLVRLFRRLGPSLLRVGGNSVDRTSWRSSSTGRAGGMVGPADIDALASFLRATGWSVLYGINLATNSPAGAAEEARYVARSLGPHLYAFEIGNEPDAYAYNHLRPPSYSYRDFINEWSVFAAALEQAAPWARLSGPASAWHETSWTVPFAKEEGRRIILLTQHYYRANGLSPQSTLALLLAGDPALPKLLDPLRQASQAAGIRDGFRLTEANSFYDGGAPHVSNTFGSALWAIDFLFANARLGSSGVNFHGGGPAAAYTPIADDGLNVIDVRPEYYGILLVSLMGAGRLLNVSKSTNRYSISAYALASRGRTCIMLVNKEPGTPIDVAIMPGMKAEAATLVTLSGPALDGVSGITLNDAPIEADGTWSPRCAASVAVRNGCLTVRMRPASAVLVTLA